MRLMEIDLECSRGSSNYLQELLPLRLIKIFVENFPEPVDDSVVVMEASVVLCVFPIAI